MSRSWLAPCLLGLLAACEFSGLDPRPSSDDPPADLFVDDSLGFQLRIPPGWSGFGPGRAPLRLTLVRDTFQDFQATMTVVAGTWPDGASPREVLRALADAKQSEPGSEISIQAEDTLSVGGRPGALLGYTLPSEGRLLRIDQAVVQVARTLLILTFVEKDSLFPERREEFRAIRAAFSFP